MNIPQDKLEQVAKLIDDRLLAARKFGGEVMSFGYQNPVVRAIIEAAQLPIVPATEDEITNFRWAVGNSKEATSQGAVREAINLLFSRRNSPPQVDPLVETTVTFGIMTGDCSECGAIVDCFSRAKHIAWHRKIAAAIRRDDNAN